MSINNIFKNASEELLGVELLGGWKVVEKLEKNKKAGNTGGWFSNCYIVESKNKGRAFLKALDYSKLMTGNTPDDFSEAFNAYIFERDLLAKCRELKLSRIVIALDSGRYTMDGSPYPADYLIFELASGDIRDYMKLSNNLDKAWILKIAHQAATGLQQLHTNGIAHQDLKPSNILIMDKNKNISKICDLGRSVVKGIQSPSQDCSIPGDITYAPPEFIYGDIPSSWDKRRRGYDMYHLGSIIMFLFTGTSMTANIMSKLHVSHRPPSWSGLWTGTYKEVLPYIKVAFSEVINDFINELPKDLKEEVSTIVRYMCDPDPNRRGHPKNLSNESRQYSLVEFISTLDLMAKKVMYGIWKMEG